METFGNEFDEADTRKRSPQATARTGIYRIVCVRSRRTKALTGPDRMGGTSMIEVSWSDRQYKVKNGDGAVWGTEASASWTPVELLECSLAFCVAKSLNIVMERDGVEADAFVVAVRAAKAAAGAPRLESFEIDVELPPLFEPGYKEKLLRHASQLCTIGNTLKRGSELRYESE